MDLITRFKKWVGGIISYYNRIKVDNPSHLLDIVRMILIWLGDRLSRFVQLDGQYAHRSSSIRGVNETVFPLDGKSITFQHQTKQ